MQRRRTYSRMLAFVVSVVLSLGVFRVDGAELTVGVFRADVTPPLGDFACVGFMPKVESIEHPLELRGIVLRFRDQVSVIAAIDYCGVCNTSDIKIRDAMAAAAGTTRDRVALQSLHQHSAPALDEDSARLLHGVESPTFLAHRRFVDDVAARASKGVTEACQKMIPVSRVIATKAKVDRVASNRRVPRPDGSFAVRASLTRDADVKNADEGLIDLRLRTITLIDSDKPVVQLHYYATHPQTFYGDSRVSWDMVGMARERLQKESDFFQIYFTGCGGNVTVGKYNEGNRASREELTNRLLDAMRQSASAAQDANSNKANSTTRAEDRPLVIDIAQLADDAIRWDVAPIKFTPRDDGTFHPETLKKQLAPDLPFSTRLTAACFLAFRQRLLDGHVGSASRLRIGEISLVHLPGEPFVEYQLFAQTTAPKSFVCVAGYGDCGVWYYGPDRIYSDKGGYEQTWSLTGPCQREVESALIKLLEERTR